MTSGLLIRRSRVRAPASPPQFLEKTSDSGLSAEYAESTDAPREPYRSVTRRLGIHRVRDLGQKLVVYSDRTGDCWLWLGSTTHDGYGRTFVGGKDRLAHVVSYEFHVGPIPGGLTLDHKCRVRHCINPAHLEPVTIGENTRRGNAPTALVAKLGRCQRGHDLAGGGRCPVCLKAAQRAWYERKLAKKRVA